MVTSSSYIYDYGPEVNTRAVVSQKVRLLAYDVNNTTEEQPESQIGALSNFSVTDSRSNEALRGVGVGDRIMELIPGVTSTTISASRAALWLQNVMQAFGYKSGIDGIVRSLRHHRWPFDIKQEMVFSEIENLPPVGKTDNFNSLFQEIFNISPTTVKSEGLPSKVSEADLDRNVLVTIYEGCWFNQCTTTFNSDSALVVENCNIDVSDVVAETGLDIDEPDYLESLSKRAFRVRS